MGCCDGCDFFVIYLKQFFDFGYNCGSIISELLGVIRTFQRITATVSFKTRFSPDCLKMFDWALVAIDAIMGIANTSPFSELEFYQVYTLILPITIMTFLLRFALPIQYFIYMILLSGTLLVFGAGLGFIGVNKAIAISLSILGFILFIGGLNIIAFTDSVDTFIDTAQERVLSFGNFCFSLRVAFFFGYALMIPIMLQREKFTKLFTIVMGSVDGIIIIFQVILRYCSEKLYNKEIGIKITDFLSAVIQLMIVPSTEHFIELQESAFKKDWRCITSYILITLFFPIGNSLLANIFGVSMGDRYKANSWVRYVAIIDMLKQMAYAIFASFDLAWGCLFTEFAWAVFLLIVRPFNKFCEYFLEVGNSIVLIAANSLILYSVYNKSDVYSIDIAIPLVVIAFIPAIVSMYIYFIFDFGKAIEYDPTVSREILKLSPFIFVPLAWLVYGLNLPLIDKKIFKII